LQYDIEAGGRLHQVTVGRAGDSFAVSVDGRVHHVDFARIDAHTLSLIVDSGRSVYETTIAPEAGGRLVVLVGSLPVAVRLNGRGRGPQRGSRAGVAWGGGRRQGGVAAGSGPVRIAAPMPGKIVRVLVRTGDAVRARQPVVVIEAMKMENELRADRDGTVAEIHAREGMSVEAGALLIVIQ
jgi:biotin carboxyl carrier protein